MNPLARGRRPGTQKLCLPIVATEVDGRHQQEKKLRTEDWRPSEAWFMLLVTGECIVTPCYNPLPAGDIDCVACAFSE